MAPSFVLAPTLPPGGALSKVCVGTGVLRRPKAAASKRQTRYSVSTRWRLQRPGRVFLLQSGAISSSPGAITMAERHLAVRRQVAASDDSVWAVCADFPNLADHWDGLKASRPIGDQTRGVGARR